MSLSLIILEKLVKMLPRKMTGIYFFEYLKLLSSTTNNLLQGKINYRQRLKNIEIKINKKIIVND